MSCIIYSDDLFLEVLPIAFTTTLSSSASPMHANNAEWFEAWNPSQDKLSITIRMQSRDAQNNVIWTLQRWARNSTILRISYPERNFDYRCVIESCPLSWQYDTVVKDFTVSFFLLTNSFIDSQTTFQYSDVASALFDNDYLSDDIYDAIGTITDINDASVKEMYDKQQQFSGYKISYLSWPYVSIWKKGWPYKYTVVMNADFVKCLTTGQDVLMYCEQNSKGTYDPTDKIAGKVPAPRG